MDVGVCICMSIFMCKNGYIHIYKSCLVVNGLCWVQYKYVHKLFMCKQTVLGAVHIYALVVFFFFK
jgi:hypothetical protein